MSKHIEHSLKPAYNTAYPALDDMVKKAKRKIPKFAFDYLSGGCNEDVNLLKNTAQLRNTELAPHYLKPLTQPVSLRTELFNHVYDAPFGVSPIGLQGLIWPGSPEILARAAVTHNVPFILSTVTTSSIESIANITDGKAWFQLYHPAKEELCDIILQRLEASGYKVLVLLCDVPSFGFRPRDIRNGLAMPPRMTLNNMFQILGKPHWALNTLIHGTPEFATLKPYMPKNINMKKLGQFMNHTFEGKLTTEKIARIRDKWKGKLVLKGVATVNDVEQAIKFGLDGVIVSNHGGRQLDAGESAVKSLQTIHASQKGKIKIMMDSGIQSGPDIARALACGAEFAFLGRTFMYSTAALGNEGGNHAMALLKAQLQQVMEQLGCATTNQLSEHLVS